MATKLSNRENIRLSLQVISGNMLRTSLTALIIAIGITALVGILTSIDAIKSSVTDTFSAMGSNSFNIRNRGLNVQIGTGGTRPKAFAPVTYAQAKQFKDKFDFNGLVSISTNALTSATATFKSEKTNPNIVVIGSDENYLETGGFKLEAGRNFSLREVEFGANVIVIGGELKKQLFKNGEDPIDKFVTIGSTHFRVIGVLEERGSSAGFGGDRSCIIPLVKARSLPTSMNRTFNITVMGRQPEMIDMNVGEATMLFRNIRSLGTTQPNNFEIVKSDAVAQVLLQNMVYVTWGGLVISIITLIGASTGLMNIMLVSVTERTREIGIRKAIGATPSVIRKQFLMEAVVICLIGGVAGIIFGLLIGNIMAILLGAQFLIPWAWILLGLIVCVGVGMVSGYYPASKASRLDPVEALRYE